MLPVTLLHNRVVAMAGAGLVRDKSSFGLITRSSVLLALFYRSLCAFFSRRRMLLSRPPCITLSL